MKRLASAPVATKAAKIGKILLLFGLNAAAAQSTG
jgi:hypothetical protein